MSERIIVAIDGSPASDAALRWACKEAHLRDADLIAVHVLSIPWNLPDPTIEQPESEEEQKAAAVLDAALLPALTDGLRIERRLLAGDATELLLEETKTGDLVVVGHRGRGHAARRMVLGSVSTHLANHSHCPCVIVTA